MSDNKTTTPNPIVAHEAKTPRCGCDKNGPHFGAFEAFEKALLRIVAECQRCGAVWVWGQP
jgi:hypothetical protein